jgi:hypothetical protein
VRKQRDAARVEGGRQRARSLDRASLAPGNLPLRHQGDAQAALARIASEVWAGRLSARDSNALVAAIQVLAKGLPPAPAPLPAPTDVVEIVHEIAFSEGEDPVSYAVLRDGTRRPLTREEERGKPAAEPAEFAVELINDPDAAGPV